MAAQVWRCSEFIDAIVCDPPYGIRAGARKTGSCKPLKHEIVNREDHVPGTMPYAISEVRPGQPAPAPPPPCREYRNDLIIVTVVWCCLLLAASCCFLLLGCLAAGIFCPISDEVHSDRSHPLACWPRGEGHHVGWDTVR